MLLANRSSFVVSVYIGKGGNVSVKGNKIRPPTHPI
jgi:hypothetical protein